MLILENDLRDNASNKFTATLSIFKALDSLTFE